MEEEKIISEIKAFAERADDTALIFQICENAVDLLEAFLKYIPMDDLKRMKDLVSDENYDLNGLIHHTRMHLIAQKVMGADADYFVDDEMPPINGIGHRIGANIALNLNAAQIPTVTVR